MENQENTPKDKRNFTDLEDRLNDRTRPAAMRPDRMERKAFLDQYPHETGKDSKLNPENNRASRQRVIAKINSQQNNTETTPTAQDRMEREDLADNYVRAKLESAPRDADHQAVQS